MESPLIHHPKQPSMRILSLLCLVIFTQIARGQNALGVFTNSSDIGNPKIHGSTMYNPGDQSYTVKGAGYNIWFARDEFHYAYRKISGDFILTGDFENVGKGTD